MPRTRSRTRARRPQRSHRLPRTRTPRNRSWDDVIDRLNHSARGELRIRMGSPGSAQVTRVRLLAQWNGVEITTVGPVLLLRLKRA